MTPEYSSRFFTDPVYVPESGANPRTAADMIAEEFLFLTTRLAEGSAAEVYLAAERAELALRAVGALHDPLLLCEDPENITDEEARVALNILIKKGYITIS